MTKENHSNRPNEKQRSSQESGEDSSDSGSTGDWGFWGGGSGPVLSIDPSTSQQASHSGKNNNDAGFGFWGGGTGPVLDLDGNDGACQCCGQPVHTKPTQSAQDPDGRYEGGNHRLALELRVDFGGSKVISGDLFASGAGRQDYLTSFRTAPGSRVSPANQQPWPVIFETTDGDVHQGRMAIAQGNMANSLRLTMIVDGQIAGLPVRQAFELTADWQSKSLRRLAVELERETGTTPPPSYEFNNRSMTLETCFAGAGIELFDRGGSSTIPRNEDGWGNTQLHALMMQVAQTDLTKAAWCQQLLWLDQPSRSGLLGVMFDSSAQLPRQGTAVFEGEIRERVPVDTDRKVIQTAVHEIGHSLNLAHRFEREVGRADSTSFMNYDWRYRGGNQKEKFWQDFNFSFDPDELEFLRHAPRNAVIPGGAAFHSVNYWADGGGGYTPYLPEAPLNVVTLKLSPPEGGVYFTFGQPVFLQAELTNISGQAMRLDEALLDPKGNFLQVNVRRLTNGISGNGEVSHFHPVMERCYDLDPTAFDVVPHGEAIARNIQIHFGSGGFSFAEPGHYEIQVFGSIFTNTNDSDPFNDRELVVASNPLKIFVAHPMDHEEEKEVATVLQREDVGAYFALGGSAALGEAKELLQEVLKRRAYRKKSVTDPIAVNIQRCFGIDAGRRYPPACTRSRKSIPGDRSESMRTLQSLDKKVLGKVFDASTSASVTSLIKRHAKALKAKG